MHTEANWHILVNGCLNTSHDVLKTRLTYLPAAEQKWQRTYKVIATNELLVALITVVVIVLLGVLLGAVNNKVVMLSITHGSNHYLLEPHNPLRFLANHDGPAYIRIAEHGYQKKHLTNFFPLYPLLIHVVHKVASSALYSALLISWMSLVGAVYYYLRIVKKLFNVKNNLEALRGVLFFVLFPTGVFLIATYTESLFAFVSLAAIYYALRKQWLPAALFSVLSTASHDNGILVLILVCLLLFEVKEKISRIAWTLIIGSVGLISYMAYLYHRFHHPLAFISAQKSQGWVQQTNFLSHLFAHSHPSNYFFLGLVIISAIYWWKRRISFSIYSILYVFIPIAGGIFGGYNRYVLMAFPVPLMFYSVSRKSPTGYQIILTASTILWTFILLQYMGGYIGS